MHCFLRRDDNPDSLKLPGQGRLEFGEDRDLSAQEWNEEIAGWSETLGVTYAGGRLHEYLLSQDEANASYEMAGVLAGVLAARRGGRVNGPRNACCFVAGTLVVVPGGLKPIEDLKVGDFVLSRNPETNETDFKPVTALISNHPRRTIKLVLTREGEQHVFETTYDHPWMSIDGSWLVTDQLKRKRPVGPVWQGCSWGDIGT